LKKDVSFKKKTVYGDEEFKENPLLKKTILNKLDADTWMWQIPLYNSTILSIGLVSNKDITSEDYMENVPKNSPIYNIKPITKKPEYPKELLKLHKAISYSKKSKKLY
jgi:hypothetical protein